MPCMQTLRAVAATFSPADFPRPTRGYLLTPGQPPTTVSGMWVNLYQNMLDDLGVLKLRQVEPGIFDEGMIRITREFQTDGGVSPTAIADEDTWRLLRDKACDRYRY